MYKLLSTALAALFLTAAMAVGQDVVQEKAKEVELVGKLVCLGCDLKANHGAAAQCSIYGHGHALKIEKTVDGRKQVLYYTFLPNDKSKPLTEEEALHGKMVRGKGEVFPGSQVLQVESFSEVKEK